MIDEIVCGDCLELIDEIQDGSVDMVLTDPPYSSGGMFRSDRNNTTSAKYVVGGTELVRPDFYGDNRDQRSFLLWCHMWMAKCYKKLSSTGSLLCFTDWRQLPTVTDAIQVAGFIWRGIYVWDKTEAARPDRGRFRHQCEYVIYATKGSYERNTDICLPGVFRKAVNSAEKFHQTGKPVELIEELLQVSPENGIVLDPFIGSGTTAVACKHTKRHFIGFELSPEYCEIARKRVAAVPSRLDSFFEDPA
ncbi:MAG: site-specific DNA-methyltransferase [Candidatus Omnitrophica bacterium]|nr:site-specific DNA-methyltransferase [Candidatus Omnitrophota bacterium]